MVWDTNAIIFFLQDLLPESSKLSLFKELNRRDQYYSIITEIELLSWKRLTEKEKLVISDFLSHFRKIELSEEVKDETIRIRKKLNIKIPDAIIAASALVQGQELLTHNQKDFEKVKGLRIFNPMEL
ncbi:MAG: toxin-antitoxin system COG1487 family toxin component [Algoriphagus marincola HL-49]|uniref:Toxin-antitoxin system COG1487 family toxin component n=1 Tax=Algoriphagus marincola HL-49 TaxID=1305737 RepID=A0A0P8AVM4_9BACT|nr:MAG: toxin-antitoxin system COG1487 family toxin component [Algoriphagus marincola HL-49]